MREEFQGRIPEIDYIFEARDVQQIVDRSRGWLDRMNWSRGFDTAPVKYWFRRAYESKAVRVDDFFPILLFYALCSKTGMREDVVEECMRCAVSYTHENNIDLAGWLNSLEPEDLDANQTKVAQIYMRLHEELRKDEIKARGQRDSSRGSEIGRLIRISPGHYRSNMMKCLALGFVVGLLLGFLLHAAFSGLSHQDDGASLPSQQGSYQPSQESQPLTQDSLGISDDESTSPQETGESAKQSSQSSESASSNESDESGESQESVSEDSEASETDSESSQPESESAEDDESSSDSKEFTVGYTALIASMNGRVRIRSKAELDEENIVAYIQTEAKVAVEVDEKTIESGGENWCRIRLTEQLTTDTVKGIEVVGDKKLAAGEIYYVAERYLSRTSRP